MTRRHAPVVLGRLARKPLALAALGWIALVTIACFTAPWLGLNDPLTQNLLEIKRWPSAAHLLGTDALGRDVLSRLLHGGATALVGVAQAVIVASVLGAVLGVTSGFLRGAYDTAVSAVIDIVLAIPTIVILLSVLAFSGQDMTQAMIALGLMGSVGIARVVRSATIAVRQDLYVDAARVNGLGDTRIMAVHILPRVAAPLIVQISLFAAAALIAQTGISFLGLGVRPPEPSWGGMISDASSAIADFPWLLVPSGGIVAITILAFGLAGDGIRDALTEAWSGSRTPPPARRPRPAKGTPTPDAETDADAVISVRNLTVIDHDGRQILAGVSYDLHRSEVLGLVGESGSGKTTTALATIGLLPAGLEVAGGELSVYGRRYDMTSRRSMRELWGGTIGLVSQEPMIALDPCYTVGSSLGEAIRRTDRGSRTSTRARVIELLQQVRIPDPEAVARKYPHQLSGGMAQRVSIARALAARPAVLVADEPTTALDVTVQAEILDLLRQIIASMGMSVIFVTHDWGVVADICDRTMVLYRGAIVETATVREIFRAPREAYTRALLAANPHSAQPGTRLPTVGDLMKDEVPA